MPKEEELESSNNLIEDRPEEEEDEEDEEEDDDYDPDKDDEAVGSEIDEDDEIEDESSGSKKTPAKGKLSAGGGTNSKANNNGSVIEEASDGLVKIDEDKITLLWSEFCNDDKASEKEPPKVEKEVVTKQYDFAGETITVQEEVVVAKPAAEIRGTVESSKSNYTAQTTTSKPTGGAPNRPPFKRPSGGLSGILGALKKPKMSTLTKSLHDWNDFKKKENLTEELDQHRRSKDSFLERQAFLGRTDLREFEREKSIREHERKVREQNSKPKL